VRIISPTGQGLAVAIRDRINRAGALPVDRDLYLQSED